MNSGWNIKNCRTILWCLWFSSYLLNKLLYIQKNLITCFWKICFLICNMLPLTQGHWKLVQLEGGFTTTTQQPVLSVHCVRWWKLPGEFRDNSFLLEHRSKYGFCGQKKNHDFVYRHYYETEKNTKSHNFPNKTVP